MRKLEITNLTDIICSDNCRTCLNSSQYALFKNFTLFYLQIVVLVALQSII